MAQQPVTDPELIRRLEAQAAPPQGQPPAAQQPLPQQPQPRPMPFPGIPQSRGPSPKSQEQRRAEASSQNAADANTRAWIASEREGEAEARRQREFNDRLKTLEANQGVDTTATQDKAAQHVLALQTELGIVNEVRKTSPRSLRPSWGEKIVSGLTQDPDYLSFTKDPQRQRASAAYRNIIESVLYLKTGAAYNQEQLQGQIEALSPQIGDDPPVLRDKMLRLKVALEGARAEAGPSNVKVQAALDEIEQFLPEMYGSYKDTLPTMTEPGLASGSTKAVPIPPEMQAEFDKWLAGKTRLDLDDFNMVYGNMAEKYGFGRPSPEAAAKFVEAFNAGRPVSKSIPAPEVEMGLIQQGLNAAAQHPVGTAAMNFANAGSFGLPELLSGAGGRHLKSLADEENPNAAFAGDLFGSIAPGAASEIAMAKLLKTGPLTSSMLGNAAYGGAREFNSSEEGEGLGSAAFGAGVGAAGALVGTGVVKGAKSWMNPQEAAGVDNLLRGETFQNPSPRGIMTSDEITPPEYQGMTDEQLTQEIAKAERGLQVWSAYDQLGRNRGESLQKVEDDILAFAENSRERQAEAIRNLRRRKGITADQREVMIAQLREQFPDDPEKIRLLPKFQRRIAELKMPERPQGLRPEQLQERINRLTDYMSQPAEAAPGRIPGVEMTTLQRAGAGQAEQVVQSIPFVRTAREKSFESWARQNSARALANIGETLPEDVPAGFAANKYVHQQLTKAYNQIRPLITGTVTREYNNGITAIRNKFLREQSAPGQIGTGVDPERAKIWGDIAEALQYLAKGKFDGNDYRRFSEQVRVVARSLGAKGDNETQTVAEQEGLRALEKVTKQVEALIKKSNPQAYARLQKINRAWAHQLRIDVASGTGGAVRESGIATPQEYMSAIRRMSPATRDASVPRDFSRGEAFDQKYAMESEKALGDRPGRPDHLGGVIVGATAAIAPFVNATPVTAALAALGFTAYTPGVKKATQFIVEGKVGEAADLLTKSLPKDHPAKNLPSGALKQMLIQAIQSKATGRTEGN